MSNSSSHITLACAQSSHAHPFHAAGLVPGMLRWEHPCITLMGIRGAMGTRPALLHGGVQGVSREKVAVGKVAMAGGRAPDSCWSAVHTHALSRPAVFAQQGASCPGGEGKQPAPMGAPQLQPFHPGVSKLFVCCCRVLTRCWGLLVL